MGERLLLKARAGRVGVEQQRLQHWGRLGRAGTSRALLAPRLPLVEKERSEGPGPSTEGPLTQGAYSVLPATLCVCHHNPRFPAKETEGSEK